MKACADGGKLLQEVTWSVNDFRPRNKFFQRTLTYTVHTRLAHSFDNALDVTPWSRSLSHLFRPERATNCDLTLACPTKETKSHLSVHWLDHTAEVVL